jgi:hypothetical protein
LKPATDISTAPRISSMMLEASHRYFHRAADLFDLEQNLRALLLTPNRIVKAELAFEGADGTIHHHVGYRAPTTGAVPTREACVITPRWTRITP